VIKGSAAAVAAAMMTPAIATADAASTRALARIGEAVAERAVPYKQSVARWCFARMPLDELCRESKRIGLQGIDLLSENEWDVPKAHGLACAVANGPGPIADGWNRPDLHDKLVAEGERLLPLVAKSGIPQMIVFSGNKRGMVLGKTGDIARLFGIGTTYQQLWLHLQRGGDPVHPGERQLAHPRFEPTNGLGSSGR
jgi:hydroxypyruvate isomerase